MRFLLVLLLLNLPGYTASAVALLPGDIIYWDYLSFDVIRLDPATGGQTVIGNTQASAGLAVDWEGSIVGRNGSTHDLWRMDPTSGAVTTIPGSPFDTMDHWALVPIPEPCTALLLAGGLASVAVNRRRFRKIRADKIRPARYDPTPTTRATHEF